MNSLEIYCISNHALHYLEDFKYRLAAVGKNKFPDHYIRCDNQNILVHGSKKIPLTYELPSGENYIIG